MKAVAIIDIQRIVQVVLGVLGEGSVGFVEQFATIEKRTFESLLHRLQRTVVAFRKPVTKEGRANCPAPNGSIMFYSRTKDPFSCTCKLF